VTLITDPLLLAGTAGFAFFVGILAAMLGIGGGFVMTPFLIIILLLEADWAASTSLFAIVFMSLATTAGFYFQKPRPINFQVGLVYACLTVLGAILGAQVKAIIPDPDLLKLIFALCLAPISAKMILFPKKSAKGGLTDDFSPTPLKEIPRNRLIGGLALAFVGGIVAGMLGLGGGVIVVPALTIALGMSIHSAVATSAFIMIFTSTAGTVTNMGLNTIDYGLGIAIAAGLVLGTQIGVRTVKKFRSEQLHSLFGAVMVVPLVKMTGITTDLAGLILTGLGMDNLLLGLLDIVIMVIMAVIIDILLYMLKNYLEKRKEASVTVESS